MNKLLIALAALTVGMPAVAGTAHDFDPSLVSSGTRPTLDGQCYETKGDSKVCFFRLTGETYAVAINDRDTYSPHPQVFTVNCDNGRYRGYGPMDNTDMASWAGAFCNSGRY